MGIPLYTRPDSQTQDSSTYLTNIDNAFAVFERMGASFAAHQTLPTANMKIQVDAGFVYDLAGTLTTVSAQETGTITAPATNPRWDRVVLNPSTGVISVVTGTEGASPTIPAIPAGRIPVCRVLLTVGKTSILNADLFDERVLPVYTSTSLANLTVRPASGTARLTLDSPENSGTLTEFLFTARDSAGNVENTGRIQTSWESNTNGSEDSVMTFSVESGGSLFNMLELRSFSDGNKVPTLYGNIFEYKDLSGGDNFVEFNKYSNTSTTAGAFAFDRFFAKDSAGNYEAYWQDNYLIADNTNGSEDSSRVSYCKKSGADFAISHVGSGSGGATYFNSRANILNLLNDYNNTEIPLLYFSRTNSGVNVSGSQIGQMEWWARDSANASVSFGAMHLWINDITSTSKDSHYWLGAMDNNTLRTALQVGFSNGGNRQLTINGQSMDCSLGTSGYISIAIGGASVARIIFQWGRQTVAANTKTAYNLPVAYGTVHYVGVASPDLPNTAAADGNTCGYNALSLSQYELTNTDGSSFAVSWFSIGY